ncbi:gamma-glutamylcyclotransferase family protein [Thiovibrio sp. JS02]
MPKSSEPAGGNNFFAYGTLQLAEVMTLATGRILAGEPSVLEGFRRCAIRNESYPGLRGEAGCRTDGILYREVDEKFLVLLDAFEGEQYERRQVLVRTADGQSLPAHVYVTAPDFLSCLSGEGWELAFFRRKQLAAFLASHGGFRP